MAKLTTSTPPAGGSYMFSSNASGRTIYVPRASVDQYKEALKDTYKNGSGATTIEPYDFN